MRLVHCGLLVGIVAVGANGQECHPVFRERLLASDGAAGDWFGTWVELHNGHLAIDAKFDDSPEFNRGSVYVYVWNGVRWAQYAQLVPPDSSELQYFGDGMGMTPEADWLVAGADGDDDLGQFSGSAYVYRRSGLQWTLDSELHATDGRAGDRFGYRTSIEWPYVFLSADGVDDQGADSGSLYVFKSDGGVWKQVGELQPPDLAAGDLWGAPNAALGAWVVGGAFKSDAGAMDGGAVYVYRNLGGDLWSLAQKLVPADLEPDDEFGWSIALSEDWLAVGARYADRSDGADAGAVYVYRRSGSEWTEFQQLDWSQGQPGAKLGVSVSLAPDTLVVGANGADTSGRGSGAVVLYRFDGMMWVEQSTITAPGVDAGDAFGTVCKLDETGDWLVGSAIWDEPFGNESGSAYAFSLRCRCLGDFNGDGAANTIDVLAFLNAWTAGSVLADFNGDGSVNTVDVLAFLNAWVAGC